MTIAPITFEWDGDAMVPLNPRLADKQYVVHERYRLIPFEDRSPRSHRHYFACIHEAWTNLPEHLVDEYPTSEHLRKRALIKAGYRDERTFVCASRKEALGMAAFIKPMDEHAFIMVREATVTVYTAQSQSTRAMGKKRFQESKEKVLDALAAMIGTDPATLRAQAA